VEALLGLRKRSLSVPRAVRRSREALRVRRHDGPQNLVRREAAWQREGLPCGLVQAFHLTQEAAPVGLEKVGAVPLPALDLLGKVRPGNALPP